MLYAEFIVLVKLWGRYVYHEPLFQEYGLRQPRQNLRNFLQGLAIGLGSLLLMFALQGSLGWVTWHFPSSRFPRILLEGGVMAISLCFVEELLFRGWLLNELERDYSPRVSRWVSSLIFALVHGLRLQLFAQVIIGLILVWSKRATQGRMGLAIGFHAGLVWGYYLVSVGQLMTYSQRVPAWITGIDQNPLAGIVGIVALSTIALWMRSTALKAMN